MSTANDDMTDFHGLAPRGMDMPHTAEEYRRALKALVEKLDACQTSIAHVCTIAAVNGGPYRGPSYHEELAFAKSLL